jgi:hypothetical protein
MLQPDAPISDVLFDLQLRFKLWLSENGLQCSCRRFTISSLARDRTNQICLFKCKAAQAPPLVAWLESLVREFCVYCPASCREEAQLLSACVWGLSTYFVVLRTSGRFFTEGEAQLLNRAGKTMLVAYSELGKHHGGGETLWHIVPKFHAFVHLIEDARCDLGNPRFFHCFSGEDLIGKLLRLARKGHASTVIDHAMSCYIVGMKQRFEAA